jgi:hypothetical protein
MLSKYLVFYKKKNLLFFSSPIVYTGCGDAIVRCFDARSGVIKRMFKSHALAVNCLQVNLIS